MKISSQYACFFLLFLTMVTSCGEPYNKGEIFRSDAFAFYPDRLVQGDFVAKAESATQMTSNYQSEYHQKVSPLVMFKFGINGNDNELPSGIHHDLVILPNHPVDTVEIKFGTPHRDETTVPENVFLPQHVKVTIRLDMRDVFKAFENEGFYTNFNGIRIYKEDFSKVYIAGNVRPLIWDFDNLVNHPDLELKDPDGDHIYTITLLLNPQADSITTKHWQLQENLAAYPKYVSHYPLMDALYNLSLEELLKNVQTDSTFRAGKEREGIWTRDISYSALLALAPLQPEMVRKSLMHNVSRDKRILQDPGTGGGYPVSSDRVTWALAAWEVYNVTGNADWLKESYAIIRNTLEDDRKNLFDEETGLMKGETSFLNWREQTYPKWMQSTDIFESFALSTNAVHYQANKILAQMATLLGDKAAAARYNSWAENLRVDINKNLWARQKGFYGQYLYGRIYKILSERPDALGEALSILFDLADSKTQKSVMANMPILPYGIPCIYPQTPFIPAYHNNAIWPFVQSFWTMAAAKVGNEQALVSSIAALYRPAALFLTNKENFMAQNGDFARMQASSDGMLWSLSGNLAIVYRVLFGMKFLPDGLHFAPYVPKVLRDQRTLTNFHYRSASLNITMEGYGNVITSFTLDGKTLEKPVIPFNLTGKHELLIELADNQLPEGAVHSVAYKAAPDMPALRYENGQLTWRIIDNAKNFRVLKNGQTSTLIGDYKLDIPQNELAEYQVITIDSSGTESFASAPYTVFSPDLEQRIELEDHIRRSSLPYKGYAGKGFIESSAQKNTNIEIPVQVKENGNYAVDFRYANGNGPINTGNRCAIRSVQLNGRFIGTIVFPQRGENEWSNWGFSSRLITPLRAGKYKLGLSLDLPANANMDGRVNTALLDYVRLIKIQ